MEGAEGLGVVQALGGEGLGEGFPGVGEEVAAFGGAEEEAGGWFRGRWGVGWRGWRFRRRGCRPRGGWRCGRGVGEGVEGGGDAAGAEVSEGGAADEVVLVGGLGVELW